MDPRNDLDMNAVFAMFKHLGLWSPFEDEAGHGLKVFFVCVVGYSFGKSHLANNTRDSVFVKDFKTQD